VREISTAPSRAEWRGGKHDEEADGRGERHATKVSDLHATDLSPLVPGVYEAAVRFAGALFFALTAKCQQRDKGLIVGTGMDDRLDGFRRQSDLWTIRSQYSNQGNAPAKTTPT